MSYNELVRRMDALEKRVADLEKKEKEKKASPKREKKETK